MHVHPHTQRQHPQEQATRGFPGLAAADRATFLVRTYTHLLVAVLGFTAIEVVLFRTGAAHGIAGVMLSLPWLLWLGAFMLVGFLATRFAVGARSRAAQYAGLALYVVAEALIFVPLLVIADLKATGVIANSALITVMGFTALTMIVFITRKDFSFLRGVLMWATFAALGFIVVGYFAGWTGGAIFPALMIALAGGWILYDTSNVLHHYPKERYVAASLALFASVALMFWYVISLFLSRD